MRHCYASAARARTAQPARAHPRWYGGATVRGGRKGFWLVPRRARATRRRRVREPRASRPARGARWRSRAAAAAAARTRTNRGHLPHEGAGASFPRRAGDRPAGDARNRRCATPAPRRCPTAAVTVDSFDYTSNYPALADAQAPDLGDRTRARRDRLPAGGNPGSQPPRRRPDRATSTPGRSARSRPGRRARFVWRVVPVKPGTYTVHYAVAAGLAGKSKARLGSGSRRRGASPSTSPAAPAHARQPEHREGRSRAPTRASRKPKRSRRTRRLGRLSKDRRRDFASG